VKSTNVTLIVDEIRGEIEIRGHSVYLML